MKAHPRLCAPAEERSVRAANPSLFERNLYNGAAPVFSTYVFCRPDRSEEVHMVQALETVRSNPFDLNYVVSTFKWCLYVMCGAGATDCLSLREEAELFDRLRHLRRSKGTASNLMKPAKSSSNSCITSRN